MAGNSWGAELGNTELIYRNTELSGTAALHILLVLPRIASNILAAIANSYHHGGMARCIVSFSDNYVIYHYQAFIIVFIHSYTSGMLITEEKKKTFNKSWKVPDR